MQNKKNKKCEKIVGKVQGIQKVLPNPFYWNNILWVICISNQDFQESFSKSSFFRVTLLEILNKQLFLNSPYSKIYDEPGAGKGF